MSGWEQRYRSSLALIVRLLLYLFVSGLLLIILLVHPGINGYQPARFGDMIYGDAARPFVYRTLVPAVVRFITDMTPKAIVNDFMAVKNDSFTLSRFADLAGIEDKYIYEFYITVVLLLLSYFAFMIIMRKLIKQYYDCQNFVSDFAPVGALLIIPIFFRYCNYIYDPATLLLFSLAILLISTGRRGWYYGVFIIATLNKETAILLTGLFILKEYRYLTKKALIGHTVIQIIIWAAIKSVIDVHFQNNPGSMVEFHLLNYNILIFKRPLSLILLGIIVFLFYRLLKYRWREKSLFLRNGFLVVFIPMVLLALFFGYIDELRQYQEAYPILFLLILPSLTDIFGIRIKTDN